MVFKTQDNMKVLNYITLLLGILVLSFYSCEEKEFIDPTPQGRIEQVFFEKDTFVFKENVEEATLSVITSKYLNYATDVTVEVVSIDMAGTEKAEEGKHFTIKNHKIKIPIGESKGKFHLKIVDDTIINPNRVFALDFKSIEGGATAGEIRQRAVIIIENDDFIPEASIMFTKEEMSIGENEGELLVPFKITKPAKGDVTVNFAATEPSDNSAYSKEGINFNILTPEVSLPAGEEEGVVKIEIIDNLIPHDDSAFDLVIRKVTGAEVAVDSICTISIINDDLDRVVAFGEREFSIREDAGTVEVPLYFTGGKDASKMATGTVVIDSLFGGAKEGDIVIENPNFSSAGDEEVPLRFTIKDNKEFRAWGAKLIFRSLDNVRTSTKEVIVNIEDDERIIVFDQTTLEVDEDGSPINIVVKLLGGLAESDIRANIIVNESGTTALPEQYRIPTVVRIDQQSQQAFITFQPFQHKSKEDKIVSLELEVIGNEKILVSENSKCEVTIKNTDGAIGFTTRGETILGLDTYTIPISLTGFDSPVTLKFAVNAPSGVTAEFQKMSDNTLNIIPGTLNAEAQIYISRNQRFNPDDIEITIETVTLGGNDVTEDLLNPEGVTYKLTTAVIENTPFDRSTWTIKSASSEELSGEGANNGNAKHMLDNNEETFWHSRYSSGTDPQPFIIIIDMQKPTAVAEVSVHIRNNTQTVELEVGDNVEDWTPIGTITLSGASEAHKSIKVEDAAVIGRYLKLLVMGNHSTIREVYVNGTQL